MTHIICLLIFLITVTIHSSFSLITDVQVKIQQLINKDSSKKVPLECFYHLKEYLRFQLMEQLIYSVIYSYLKYFKISLPLFPNQEYYNLIICDTIIWKITFKAFFGLNNFGKVQQITMIIDWVVILVIFIFFKIFINFTFFIIDFTPFFC